MIARLVTTLLVASLILAVPARPARADAASAVRLSSVIARILSYERTLPGRAGATVDILIVHAPGNAGSSGEARAFERGLAALSSSTVQGLPVRASVVAYSPGAIENAAGQGADVVIVCSGLEGSLDSLVSASRRRRLLTVGVARDHAVRATALAVVLEDGRPKIIANLAHARAEGVQLSSQLLRLVEVL